jgi:hypothetical protein
MLAKRNATEFDSFTSPFASVSSLPVAASQAARFSTSLEMTFELT